MAVDITYLDIQRLSTEDGPGLRTTLFFKGCPLSCSWCHNPESISFKPEIVCLEDRCFYCGLCESVCPCSARTKSETNRELCEVCASCEEACPAAAIERKGTSAATDLLLYELLKDKAYWCEYGGVTLSGGEAASQAEGAFELLRLLKQENVHTALDTCGQASWSALRDLLPYVDLLLYDIKLIDPELHIKYTGFNNNLILENARHAHESSSIMWVRTPIIPGATDSDENIRAIGNFIKEYLPNIKRWELCSFNNLCRDKYRRLGKVFEYADSPLMTQQRMEQLCEIGLEYFQQTVWTGATKLN